MAGNGYVVRASVVFRRSITFFGVGRSRVLAAGTVAAAGQCNGFAGPHYGLLLSLAMAGQAHGPKYRVLTCNVGGKDFDESSLLAFIAQIQPDFIALQGCQDPRALSP